MCVMKEGIEGLTEREWMLIQFMRIFKIAIVRSRGYFIASWDVKSLCSIISARDLEIEAPVAPSCLCNTIDSASVVGFCLVCACAKANFWGFSSCEKD